MSDHFSGPRAIADPTADIADLYVFPSPERPGHLVLVMNVFPAVMPGALFSDAVVYRFRLRPVTGISTGARPAFEVGQTEYVFSCTFAAPVQRNGSEAWLQMGTCTTPAGEMIFFRVNDEPGTEAQGLRVFAGPRLDPFFIDLPGVKATEKLRRLAFKAQGSNSLEGQNVLSIVVEAEVGLFGSSGPLFAVVGETMTTGKAPLRLERVGRPEIKNVVMSSKEFDPLNRDLEIRDLYNQEDPFHLAPTYAETYRARLNAHLAFFDSLDGETDWPPDEQGNHPLTKLLLADFLVVDVSKPYAENSCFEIEQALLKGRVPETCGGRSLNDDIVDSLYTLLVNGGNGPRIRDGVDQATRPAARRFPYLVSPNPNPPDLKAGAAALSAQPQGRAQ
ncbi:MAG: DUF4331 family protein [Anaerolineales bacterium]|nr:DUF4331 family protein [Anaerolineales bacterium]